MRPPAAYTGPPGASGAGAGPSTSDGLQARCAAGASVTPAVADRPQPGPFVQHEPALRSLAEAAALPLHESLHRVVDRATPVAAAPAAAGTQPATGTATEHTDGEAAAAAGAPVARAGGPAGAGTAAGAAASPTEPAAARGVPMPPVAAQDILLRVAEVAVKCMEAAAAAAPVAPATGGPGQLSAAHQHQQLQPLWGRLSADQAALLAAVAVAFASPILNLHALLGCIADSAGRPIPCTAATAEAAAGRWWRLLVRMLQLGRWAPGSAADTMVVNAVLRGLEFLHLDPGGAQQRQQPLPSVTICPGLPVALAAGLLPRLIEPVLRRQTGPTGRRFDPVLEVLRAQCDVLVTAAAAAAADSTLQRSGSSHGGSSTSASAGGVAAVWSTSSLCLTPMTAVAALLVREVLPAAVDLARAVFTGGLEALHRAADSPGAPGPRGRAAGGEERRRPGVIPAAATASARERFSMEMQQQLTGAYPCLLGWLVVLTSQCSGGGGGGNDRGGGDGGGGEHGRDGNGGAGDGDGAEGGAAECWGDTDLRTFILQALCAGELVRSALLAFAAAAPLLAAAPEVAADVARDIVDACIRYAALSPRDWRAMVEGRGSGAGPGSPAGICGVYWDAEPWCDHMALVLGAAADDPTAEGASSGSGFSADVGDEWNEEDGSLMAQLLAVSRKLSRIAATATAAATVTGSGSCGGGPAPAAVEAAEDAAAVDAAWWQLVARLRRAVQKRRAAWAVALPDGRLVMQPLSEARAQLQLPRPCSNSACVAMEGDCEAEVQLKACGGACGGAVAYCCRACQLEDWRAGHKTACGGRAADSAQVAQGQA
ncbi:hypothetical protein HXX76_009848 [Chlamydomonas incerta]|uniref:MYND-type domain-containing protein n=1 Tax=Chlamydomonas incerta TaxID=51695 RepID=A0A835VZ13_CHLIN|nr:hypothetical protein HXX76_009848 [Chlamydomonas incerta]|eukprot:KAG2430874.1 hypothetical protein HXX76_009848 [Chlamydomonas incerta]